MHGNEGRRVKYFAKMELEWNSKWNTKSLKQIRWALCLYGPYMNRFSSLAHAIWCLWRELLTLFFDVWFIVSKTTLYGDINLDQHKVR